MRSQTSIFGASEITVRRMPIFISSIRVWLTRG